MKKCFFEQKTPDTRFSARYVERFALALPAGKVDLYQWATGMTDDDYTSYAPAHLAMSSFIRNKVFHMKNVENIGIETLIQRYQLRYHASNHLQFYSPNTTAYILRWFPATIGVPWELYVQPFSDTHSILICMIGVDFPSRALKLASWISSLGGRFLKMHLREEGEAFVRDIEKKFSPN